MRNKLWILPLLLILFVFTACGESEINTEKEIETAVQWVKEAAPAATVGSIGGDWAVKGIAASSVEAEEHQAYYARYYDDVRAKVKASKGVLDDTYYTTYGRVIIGVTAIGENPLDVEGYNLVEPLDHDEAVLQQGINAAAFALIGSNLADTKLKNEETYITYLMDYLEENKLYEELDMTDYVSMAMEGLSFYQEREDVAAVIETCIDGLSDAQLADGSMGNCESTAEAIIALTMVDVDPVNDARFVKDGKSLLDGLLLYKGTKGYLHQTDDTEGNQAMSTEKALLALDSVRLFNEGKKLYE